MSYAMTYGSKQWRPWVFPKKRRGRLSSAPSNSVLTSSTTADMYSVGASEEVLGRALNDFGPGRDRIMIATKVFYPISDDANDRGLSRKHIFNSIDLSLKRLGTDYVDLYQIHRFDYDTPIEETLIALNDLGTRGGKSDTSGLQRCMRGSS